MTYEGFKIAGSIYGLVAIILFGTSCGTVWANITNIKAGFRPRYYRDTVEGALQGLIDSQKAWLIGYWSWLAFVNMLLRAMDYYSLIHSYGLL